MRKYILISFISVFFLSLFILNINSVFALKPVGCTETSDYSTITGQSCSAGEGTYASTYLPSCSSISGYSLIKGQSCSVLAKTSTIFNFKARDPNNNNLSWFIDWGDTQKISKKCPSSSPNTFFSVNHSWATAGTYNIKLGVSNCKAGGDASASFNVVVKNAVTVPTPSSCTKTWYRDFDGDGYGSAADAVMSCTQPAGYVANGTDCYDKNSEVYPGSPTSPAQTKFFSVDRGDGSFDYNCSQGNEKKYDTKNWPPPVFNAFDPTTLFTAYACSNVQSYPSNIIYRHINIPQGEMCTGVLTGNPPMSLLIENSKSSCYNINYLQGGPFCGSEFYLCLGQSPWYTLNSCTVSPATSGIGCTKIVQECK